MASIGPPGTDCPHFTNGASSLPARPLTPIVGLGANALIGIFEFGSTIALIYYRQLNDGMAVFERSAAWRLGCSRIAHITLNYGAGSRPALETTA